MTWPIAHLDDENQPVMPLDFETIRDTGLLWKINHDLLHPLGLALAVKPSDVIPDDLGALQLSILVATDGEWEFAPPVINDEYREKFNTWYQAVATALMDPS